MFDESMRGIMDRLETEEADEAGALRQLLSDLYDVATEQRIHHRCRGDCPEPATGNHHWRDEECPACQVLTRVSAAVGLSGCADRDDSQRAEAGDSIHGDTK